ELMAALDPFDKSDFDANFDFSLPSHLGPDGNFWLDFCADTGDGWRPTHAVARLLARSQLEPAQSPQGEPSNGPLLQGRVLFSAAMKSIRRRQKRATTPSFRRLLRMRRNGNPGVASGATASSSHCRAITTGTMI